MVSDKTRAERLAELMAVSRRAMACMDRMQAKVHVLGAAVSAAHASFETERFPADLRSVHELCDAIEALSL